MSRLEELIQELCPDGVEYKPIGEICDICRGRVMSKEYISENKGEYPVYSSQTENNGELGRIATFDFDGEYLSWTTDGANAGTVFYRNGKFSVTNVCGLLKIKNDGLLTKYLYYTLNAEAPKHVNSGMGNHKLMSNVMAKITIPVPPLPVQEEIVRILDNFTELTTELTTELEARKKQYEYYREELLHLEGEKITIQELFDSRNGFTPSKDNPDFWENGALPWFKLDDINSKGRVLSDSYLHITPKALKKTGLFPENSIIISTSATIGEYALITVPFLCNQRFTCLTLKPTYRNRINVKFLMHYCPLLSKYCKEHLNQGNFASVDMKQFVKFEFVSPSLEEQNHIVSILDRFDALCNDLSSGLPAEIEARKKQYEYYRDKLLTFKELGA